MSLDIDESEAVPLSLQ